MNILCKHSNTHADSLTVHPTRVPWVSERCRQVSTSKPSQEMMRRDTKMRREEGEEKNRQRARDNATLVHHITAHTQTGTSVKWQPPFPLPA
jgi:hypothetical protein